MSTRDATTSPATAILALVDELLATRRHPSDRDITTIHKRLGVCNISDREYLFRTILMRIPEREESDRWQVLAAIILGLTLDIRLKSQRPHSLTLAKEAWRLHGHEAGCGKMVILCLREVQFYWER